MLGSEFIRLLCFLKKDKLRDKIFAFKKNRDNNLRKSARNNPRKSARNKKKESARNKK